MVQLRRVDAAVHRLDLSELSESTEQRYVTIGNRLVIIVFIF